jgi:hypothetical protein
MDPHYGTPLRTPGPIMEPQFGPPLYYGPLDNSTVAGTDPFYGQTEEF